MAQAPIATPTAIPRGADSDSDTELDLKLSDDNAVLNGESKSYTVDNGTSSQTSFAVVSIGLGDILDLSVIDIKKQAKVSVEEGTTRSITLQGKGGGVSIGSVFDLLIYKLNPETGNYDKYHVEKNFLKILLLGGVGDEVEITLPAGTMCSYWIRLPVSRLRRGNSGFSHRRDNRDGGVW
ncbi:hypothetical protein O0544_22190 [Edwardsiella anguillarum]|nr:hypothetical protein [Edwardsiella anguillarum]